MEINKLVILQKEYGINFKAFASITAKLILFATIEASKSAADTYIVILMLFGVLQKILISTNAAAVIINDTTI